MFTGDDGSNFEHQDGSGPRSGEKIVQQVPQLTYQLSQVFQKNLYHFRFGNGFSIITYQWGTILRSFVKKNVENVETNTVAIKKFELSNLQKSIAILSIPKCFLVFRIHLV